MTDHGQPESPGDQVYLRAMAALELGKFETAEEEARLAIAGDATDPENYVLLANALLCLGYPEDALEAAETGLGCDPAVDSLHRLRSRALLELEDYDEALVAADEAVRLAPETDRGHAVRSEALEELERFDEAMAAAKTALHIDPGEPANLSRLGYLYLDHDPEIAERYYRKSLAIEPRDAVALHNLGLALMHQDRFYEAATAQRSAIFVDPSLSEPKYGVWRNFQHMSVLSGLAALPMILVVLGISFVIVYFDVPAGGQVGLMFLAAVASIGSLKLMINIKQKKMLERLAETDPQLFELYKRLEREYGE